MLNKVIRLENALDNAVSDEFHAYRVKFNKLFLSEEFASAYASTLKMMDAKGILPHEKLELARNLMILGYPEEALQCLNLVLVEEPQNIIAIEAKLQLLKNMDLQDQYSELLLECIKIYPGKDHFYGLLYKQYQQLGDIDGMQRVLQEAELNNVPIRERELKTSTPAETETLENPSYEDPLLVESFLTLFQGRENYHARQWVSDKGKAGYAPVSEPINPTHIRGHLMGLYTLGVYQLNLSNRVKWIVFDLDVAKEYITDLNDPQFKCWIEGGFRNVLLDFRKLLEVYHISALYEFSGFKGYHVWLLFEDEISAGLAQGIARKLAAQIDLGSYPFCLEIFPKQTRISQANFGNLVKLPGGVHKLTGLRSYFVEALEDKLLPMSISDAVKSVPLISTEQLMNLVHSLQPDFSTKEGQPLTVQNAGTQNLEVPAGDPLSDPQWLWMKERCSILRGICQTIEVSRELSNNQKKVITYTVGMLPQGVAIVNALLQNCRSLLASDLLKSQLKGNPMSCNKIRAYLANEANLEPCNCDFSALNSGYDTPLLHLSNYVQSCGIGTAEHEQILRDTIQGYLELRKKNRDYQTQLKRTETKIFSLFEEIGVSEFKTPFGILKIIIDNEQKKLILEM